jgi:phospholipid transport system substrate-binding protein
MQSHLASWIVVLGMATAVTGCASLESSGGTSMVDTSNHQWLKRQPASIVIVDGGNRVAPLEYSPTESVKNTITEVLSILGNEVLKQPGRVEERRQQIEQVIRHRINFEQMAQRSLGAPWMRLNDTERQEFVSLFVQLIRDTVANKIDQYYDEQVFYLVEQRKGSFAEVRTNLIGPKVDTSLDFRLENHSGDWLVYDVVIDGASTVRSYRTQFGRIIRDTAYAGLVEKMKQRALTVKWFEKTVPAIALLTTDTSDSR